MPQGTCNGDEIEDGTLCVYIYMGSADSIILYYKLRGKSACRNMNRVGAPHVFSWDFGFFPLFPSEIMANKNSDLAKARRKKDDEYYTLFEDIATEVPLYRNQLRGKNIICPCDWDECFQEALVYKEEGDFIPNVFCSEGTTIKRLDITQSRQKIERNLNTVRCNFVKFLVAHAEDYGIRSISVSGYNPATKEGVRFQDIDYSKYDLVITNPPFSQITDFFDVMMKFGTKFLVIGPQTAIGYKNSFRYIKENRMWLGYHFHLQGFLRPDGTQIMARNPDGAIPRACCWFTNLDVSYRRDRMILTEEYAPEKYPKYDEYDAIEVSRTKNIPDNYAGIMGVPITFLQKYSPIQFEIVGIDRYVEDNPHYGHRFKINGRETFARILIRNLEVSNHED